jgi:hypothetical protein
MLNIQDLDWEKFDKAHHTLGTISCSKCTPNTWDNNYDDVYMWKKLRHIKWTSWSQLTMGRGICYYNVSPYSWIIDQTIKDLPTDRSKIEHHYYVNMFHYNPTMVEERPKEVNAVIFKWT